MAEKKKSLKQWYKLVLDNNDIHNCTVMDLSAVNVDTLFEDTNARLFILNYFESLRSDALLKGPGQQLLDILRRITPFRAQHTVSSFLLGIAVKEELSLDTRNWIRVFDTHSSDPTFGFFWSLICLTHDIAYNWENRSSKWIDEFRTLPQFLSCNNIRYNLLEQTKHAELISDYYRYIIEQRQRVDHGITGAILIYDALMSFYHNAHSLPASELCGMKLRKNFPDFCLRISETVALHNMWRASPKTAPVYRDYSLYPLIPTGEGSEIIHYREDPLLFLLCLIDTIDPIKLFCNAEGGSRRLPAEDVLNGYLLWFSNQSRAKKLSMEFENELFSKWCHDKISDMETWLDVRVTYKDARAQISFPAGVEAKKAAEPVPV